ncbi:thioredoxin-like 1-2, chloroplastic [Rhododendron vialii]|uniref:thioredoxin-like 1-2, chloroplastic n=1 Tax=Rhododendron vialii TaxID=182163 RepID=UPI00265FE215|nr:thioredoxin-like 1-2, chloroplastic [Rhododendron vialii]
MACSFKTGPTLSGSHDTILGSKHKGVSPPPPPSIGFLQLKQSNPPNCSTLAQSVGTAKYPTPQPSLCVSRSLRWWEKTLQPNMVEIRSAQEFVDSLLLAGDRLVIVDFYSPGCGGCKSLHPKICQLAESNENAIILKVNYEQLKKMCHCLHIHVLPFFRFYRGAEGRLCSFSCTNATIKKFKDALAKHGTARCDLGPAKGLDESELLSLASIGEISFNLPLPSTGKDIMQDLVLKNTDLSGGFGISGNSIMGIEEEVLA